MIGLLVNNTFLDMSPDTQVTIEINSPVYTGGDPTNIQGTLSFPFTVPLTGPNKLRLNHPHRVDMQNNTKVFYGVLLYAMGLPIYKGELHVLGSTNTTASLTFIVNPLADIKELDIEEVITEKLYTSNSQGMQAVMNYALTNPANQDVIFFPVFNREWKSEEERESGNGEYNFMLHRTQNFYDIDKQKFVVDDPKNTAVTPFLKAKFIIEKIIAASNYIYVDEFFSISEELEQLYFYNNYSISLQDGSLDAVIDYKNHVPNLKCNEALKQFCSLFFLGIFTNSFDGTMSLIPLENVLTASEATDWTSKIHRSYSNENNDNTTPGEYLFATDSNDMLSNKHLVRNFVIDGEVDTDLEVPIGSHEAPLYYYTTHQNQVIKSTTRLTVFKYFLSYKGGTGLTTYEISMIPIYMTLGLKFLSYTYSIYLPEIAIRGRNVFNIDQADNEDTPEGITAEDDTLSNTASARLMFYRGMQPTRYGKLYPMGSNHNRNFNGDRIGEYSLLLNGPDGIIEKWGKEVVRFMENRRTVQRNIDLSIRDIINFRPQHKVRIENMNYLVSKMKVTFTMSGILPTECTLESVN